MTDPTPAAICAIDCTSGCHATDCEHHDHLPAPADEEERHRPSQRFEDGSPPVCVVCDETWPCAASAPPASPEPGLLRERLTRGVQDAIDPPVMPCAVLVDGPLGEGVLIPGATYRVAEVREHWEPTGVEGESPHISTVIRFDPAAYRPPASPDPGLLREARWCPPTDERVSIHVHPEARDALADLLNRDPRLRGVGYSEFVMRAVRAVAAPSEVDTGRYSDD